jgi:hypothetical protein
MREISDLFFKDEIKVLEKSKIFVRVDDLGTDDLPRISKIVSACKQNNIPVILAVIPKKLSSSTIDFLKDELRNQWPGLIVAQHGVTHLPYEGYVKKMEFSLWEPVEEIKDKLKIGKDILVEKLGIPIGWYVPPWNKYGRNLVHALEELKFYAFSASTRLPFYSKILANFPINQDIADSGTKENETDPQKIFSKSKQLLVDEGRCGLMLHHHTMNEQHLRAFEEWIKHITVKNVVVNKFTQECI